MKFKRQESNVEAVAVASTAIYCSHTAQSIFSVGCWEPRRVRQTAK